MLIFACLTSLEEHLLESLKQLLNNRVDWKPFKPPSKPGLYGTSPDHELGGLRGGGDFSGSQWVLTTLSHTGVVTDDT